MVCPGVVVWPVVDPGVCPVAAPGVAPAVPTPAVPPACNEASTIPLDLHLAVGPGVFDEGLVHWSAILVAPVTLNSLLAPAVVELEFVELEFIPEFAPAGVDALALVFPAAPAPAELDPLLLAAAPS